MTNVELCFDIWFKFFDIIQEEQAINSKDNNIELMLQQIKDDDITVGMEIKINIFPLYF